MAKHEKQDFTKFIAVAQKDVADRHGKKPFTVGIRFNSSSSSRIETSLARTFFYSKIQEGQDLSTA